EQIGHAPSLGGHIDARGAVEQGAATQAHVALLGGHEPGNGLEQQALARSRGTEDHQALAVAAQADPQVEHPWAGTQRLVDIQIKLHGPPQRLAMRPGARRPASSNTVRHSAEVISTSRLAVSSWPACTAS